ncbi:aminopeptidase [Sporolactobacillus sp. CQH2019]|uniref:aminopeptidase n=1 Tax=Sporolactobacillus sp. CQH2019 TaxID=3023512 RepID=UPI002368C3C0|nr:aminopeptidase [Sporolactobacillus sp. CQH2019]MDD9147718.1 aminopeptidase [Sporolactobacillus sp. CQH2019]
MKKFEEGLKRFAELAIKTGVNLQKGQGLLLTAPVEASRFADLVAEAAYKAGARDVFVDWTDDATSLLRFRYAPLDALEHIPSWKFAVRNESVQDNYAVLNIYGPNPDLLKDVDGTRSAAYMKAAGQGLSRYREFLMKDKIQWSLIAYPTVAWSKKVFPGKPAAEAQERLMEEILRISRVTGRDDPEAAWKEHNKALHAVRDFLNRQQFKQLIYRAEGTDLSIDLPEGHIWNGGSSPAETGVEFNANIPTEEVFTMPHKRGVNGTVAATMPLNYDGQIIDHFSLTFKDGKAVAFKAEKGEEALRHLLESDAGARRLGEVALVPHRSPVSASGLVFYNTLFDENASCHLALGKAYASCIEGGSKMDGAQLDHAGVNDSIVHEDFMVGSAGLDIDGVKKDGTKTAVFRRGEWAFSFDEA